MALTVVIAVISLIPAALSGVATWFAWRTAQASEEIARNALKQSGAVLTTNKSLVLRGECGNPQSPLTGTVEIQNSGQLPAKVTGAFLMIEPFGPEEGFTIMGSKDAQLAVVDAQGFIALDIPIDCGLLHFFEIDSEHAGPQIADSITSGRVEWLVMPRYTIGQQLEREKIDFAFFSDKPD